MKLTKCPEGHGYDAEKFDSCPVCARSKTGARRAKVVKVKAVRQAKSALPAEQVKAAPAPVKEEKKPEAKAAPAPVKEEKKPEVNKPTLTIEDSPIKKPAKKSLYDNQIIYDADFRPVEEHYKPNEVKADDIKQVLSKNKSQKAPEPVAAKTESKPKDNKEPDKFLRLRRRRASSLLLRLLSSPRLQRSTTQAA